jgi:release factor glutamine methyltransferase
MAVDLDPAALETAAANAQALGLAERITFLQGDLFAPLPGRGPFDLIACNPPYIPAGDIPKLMPEVRDHEPRLALDGGPDGLDVVRRVLQEAPALMKPGGWLLLELGEGQAEAVAQLAAPHLAHEATRDDLRGIPRIVILRKK